MEEVCENCELWLSFDKSKRRCGYWVITDDSCKWIAMATMVKQDNVMGTNYCHPATPATFGCNAWKEKVKGPFRVKGRSVQFFDGKFWAESAWSSENLEGWLNRMWARHKEPAIRFDVSTIMVRGHKRYQPVIWIGKRNFSIGKHFYCDANARERIDQLKEGL